MSDFKMTLPLLDFKKWEVLKISSNCTECIVIRTKNNTVTTIPYKRHKNKFIHKLWFKWLKLRVWIGDFYK